jgi:hypothetical protein
MVVVLVGIMSSLPMSTGPRPDFHQRRLARRQEAHDLPLTLKVVLPPDGLH